MQLTCLVCTGLNANFEVGLSGRTGSSLVLPVLPKFYLSHPLKVVSFECVKCMLLADFYLSCRTGKRKVLPVLQAISKFLPVRDRRTCVNVEP